MSKGATQLVETEESLKRKRNVRIRQVMERKQQEAQLEKIKKAKKKARKLTLNLVIIITILTLLTIWFSSIGLYYFALLFNIGLLPALVAYITDTRKKRLASKTVIALNLAGMVSPCVNILMSGSPDYAARTAINDPQTWLFIYGFAAAGWCLVLLIPYITKVFLDMRAEFMVKQLNEKQNEIAEEWGDKIKQG